MRRLALCALVVVACAAPTRASQDDIAADRFAEQQAQQKPNAPAEKAEKQEIPRTEREPPQGTGQLANIRLEVTITDQRATGQPTTKTVSLTLANGANGRIRTNADVPVQMKLPGGAANFVTRSVMLNVDARPVAMRDSKIRTEMTLEYRPTGNELSTDEQSLTTISESFTVVLDDGKPLVVSQSADPNTDRRVRVEVKATILK